MLRKTPNRTRAAVVAALLAGTALGGFAGMTVPGYAQSSAAQPAPSANTIQPTGTQHPLPDFSDLAAQVSPAVVSVTVREADHSGEARGSGFVIDPDGTIVTNNHVVDGGNRVSVTLSDGTELPAKIVGRDPRSDLAVLHVDAGHKLPSLQLGDSDGVRPGEWVVAIGNPYGLGGTVTAGIVSARGRDIGAGPYDSFLQVDAAINRGNSGGPLFTQDGRVVGVNTAILSPTGGSIGIGFAIPSNLVKNVVGQLRTAGHVTRGYLGVATQPVTAAIAGSMGLGPDTHGALIAGVEPDSPAAKAGMQPGDVVQSVGGTPIENPHALAQTVASIKPGEQTDVAVLRGGEKDTLHVTVASLPDQQMADNGPMQGNERGIGVALAPLSPEVRDQLQLPDGTKGAVIAEVRPGSPAQQAGLREGDVIVGVGSKAVNNPREAADAIRGSKGVALRVLRDGQPRFVAIPGPARG